MNKNMKIVLPGGAGLVGQNLVAQLKRQGYTNLVVLDKHVTNLGILRKMHPDIVAELVDLADRGDWEKHLAGAEVVVMLQAQIGGTDYTEFERNNITSTKNVIEAMRAHNVPYYVQISSSVVESVADDWYTNTKKAQEEIALASGFPLVVLRPTLMFGWFDRKHLGWLARFMRKTPVFPIPGNGRYLRQPLYAGDFCNVIISAIERPRPGEIHNISGRDRIDYIDLMREVRHATGARTAIVKIPYSLFKLLLDTYALVDRDPPFTSRQLEALVTPDEFEVIDWPAIFAVRATPLREALAETFGHPVYSKVVLEF